MLDRPRPDACNPERRDLEQPDGACRRRPYFVATLHLPKATYAPLLSPSATVRSPVFLSTIALQAMRRSAPCMTIESSFVDVCRIADPVHRLDVGLGLQRTAVALRRQTIVTFLDFARQRECTIEIAGSRHARERHGQNENGAKRTHEMFSWLLLIR